MHPLTKAYYILRHLGPRVVWLRAGLHARDKLGLTRRWFKHLPWAQINLAEITKRGTPVDVDGYASFKRKQSAPFLFPLGQPPIIPSEITTAVTSRTPSLAERVRLLTKDRCVYFFKTPSPEPIDWHRNPFENTQADPGKLWYDLPDFDPTQGDPRTLWEPSRAAWAIDLARARAHGIEEATGDLYWRWVDSWMAANPPFMGLQWKCGQESSVRLIALAIGFWAFADDPATTLDRWTQFARLAWATGYRVAHHINYAVSQKNNHALSEACGLLMVSQLFPEFRESPRWGALGRKVLSRELRRQTYTDGSYLQHSMNYHRVMLHAGILGLRLAELADRPFERMLYDRLARCGEFLIQMMEPTTGRVPNYGHNDGANVLPLSECDFTDYRPVVQTTDYLATRASVLPSGPGDEDLLWLFGGEALEAAPRDSAQDRTTAGSTDSARAEDSITAQNPAEHPQGPRGDASTTSPLTKGGKREVDYCTKTTLAPKPVSTAFDVGGYYTLRRENSWAMIRCHTYRDRPSHCDPLHVDLWWQGHNILQDCGTYRYYVRGRSDVERYFKSIAGQNTIKIDGREPVELVSRFLWLPWWRARKRHFEARGYAASWFEGEHYGYARAPTRVLHRRTLIGLTGDVWLIVDDLFGKGEHSMTLYWHLLDAPYEVNLPETGQARDTSEPRGITEPRASARAEIRQERPPSAEHPYAGQSMVTLSTPSGPVTIGVTGHPHSFDRFEVIRGRDERDQVQGFAAPYYGTRDPIPTIEAETTFWRRERVLTVVCPGTSAGARLAEDVKDHQQWTLTGDADSWIVDLANPDRNAPRVVLDHRANVSDT